jgi:uncharacterized damage-inducible protein DinB
MKRIRPLFIPLLVLMAVSFSRAQDDDERKPLPLEISIPKVLTTSIIRIQHLYVPLASAMPEDKYGFAPSNGEFKGVRTFGQQLKHVAAVNFIYASTILGEKPPEEVGEEESGPASVKTKADILKYLNSSFAYVQKATASINEKNLIAPIKNPFGEGTATRLAMTTLIVGHCFDHYGQMVEYLRMNGIVPPASRDKSD